MRKLFTIFLVLTGIMAIPAFGQNGYNVYITGEDQICTGSGYEYSVVWEYAGSPASPPAGGTHTWTVYGGTVYTSGSTYAFIGWANDAGFMLYEYTANGTYYYATLEVSPNCMAGLSTPPVSNPGPNDSCRPGVVVTEEVEPGIVRLSNP
ncbi:hypothetical protein FNH22_05745 [Fulvivirga sp. M361]|uniref:hypothetical protein n=1 Tax=Fulvivirga sp. M361 TaxID=2594266 RepID=UPI00117B6A8F|nr:hypothetical protein [Fulvivirga sp. M361]TRX60552.1 hypothetical protein FNH22_05745 [Fulvivirga sp. M361]